MRDDEIIRFDLRLLNPYLSEAAPQRRRQFAFAEIAAGVHRREQTEVRMSCDDLECSGECTLIRICTASSSSSSVRLALCASFL